MESIKPEALLAACIAVAGVVWRIVAMVFGLHRRVEATEKDFKQLKEQNSAQYLALRQEIRENSTEAKAQHAELTHKIDRIIERQMK